MPAPAVTVTEMLNKGLVTARDPSLLRPGELQRCNDCIYHPNDQAIWKAPGRTKYNADAAEIETTTTVVKGIRYVQFDAGPTDASQHLIAYAADAGAVSNYYYSSFDAATGTFTEFDSSVGSGACLEAVHYNNRYYLLNGNTDNVPNRVIKPELTAGAAPVVRRHGLDPVTTPPDLAISAGAGWPSVDEGFGTGFYFILTTEVVNPDTEDEVESTVEVTGEQFDFASTPKVGVIEVTDLTAGISVTRPPQVNPSATHWRIYLHGPEDSPDWNPIYLADMIRQGTLDIDDTVTILGSVASLEGPYLGGATGTGTNWDLPTNILTIGSGAATGDTSGEVIIIQDFGVVTATIGAGPINGISVELSMQSDVHLASALDVDLSWNAGTSWTNAQRVQNTRSNFYQTHFAGSPLNTWGRTWTASEFANANFRVRLTFRRLLSLFPGTDIDVDYAVLRVYYGDGGIATKAGELLPSVCIQVGNIVSCVGANGPPPIASTGDIYEGQLVLNDVSDRSLIRYSLPDGVDYFPSIYFVNFETKDADVVNCIRRIGDKLIVGLQHQIYRVNYLPRATDSEFDRGRCYEAVSEGHGMVGTHAYALFSPPNRSQLLAYVSTNGLHATDGFQSTTLTEDIDWERMVNVEKLDTSILVNYPKYYSLVFYYIPADDTTSTKPTRALWLNYHPSHVKEGGKLLVSGPVKNIAASAHLGRLDSAPALVTGQNDGHVYLEDQAFNDESASGGIAPDIVTRDIYPAGIGWEATLERLWIRHYQHTPTTTVTVDPYYRNTETEFTHASGVGNEWTTKTFTTARGAPLTGSVANLINGGALSRLDIHMIGESMLFRLTAPEGDNGMALSYLSMEVAGHGLEEKGGA